MVAKIGLFLMVLILSSQTYGQELVMDCKPEHVKEYCEKWFESRKLSIVFSTLDSVGAQGVITNPLTGKLEKLALAFYIKPNPKDITLTVFQYDDLNSRDIKYNEAINQASYNIILRGLEKELFDYCRIKKALSQTVQPDRPVFNLGQSLQEVQKEIVEVKASGMRLTDTALTEGRITPRVTKLIVSPVKRFTVNGSMGIVFDKPDTVTSVTWLANDMSIDDFKYIHDKLVEWQGKEDTYDEKLHINELHYMWQMGPLITLLSYDTRTRVVSLSRSFK